MVHAAGLDVTMESAKVVQYNEFKQRCDSPVSLRVCVLWEGHVHFDVPAGEAAVQVSASARGMQAGRGAPELVPALEHAAAEVEVVDRFLSERDLEVSVFRRDRV